MSNKTPKVSAKKIKWALKAAGLLLFAVLITYGLYFKLNNGPTRPSVPTGRFCLKVGDNQQCNYDLEAARTNQEQLRGLSGRDGLAPQTGMIFIFDRPDGQCFWMKDMKFSIDIIWLNSNKEIIKLQENVAPETYPDSFCANDARYVIELAAGEARRSGLEMGQKLEF